MKAFISIVILLTCFSATAWSIAGDHKLCADQSTQNPQIVAEMAEIPPLLSEIRAVMDSTRAAEKSLRDQYPQGQDPELTRRLGELKNTSRMRILHIQLKYARNEGRVGLEKRILTSIEGFQRPAAPDGPRLSGRISPLPEAQAAVTPAGGSRH